MIQVASAIGLMTIFLAYMVLKYGWLPSISDSYYELSRKWLFQVTMIAFAVLLLVGVHDKIHSPFIPMACFGIVLVAVAPRFQHKGIERFSHFFGAYSAILFGFVGLLVDFGLWWPLVVFVPAYIALNFTVTRNKVYWSEVLALYLIGIILLYCV